MFDAKKRSQIQSEIRHKIMFNSNTSGKIDVIDAEPGIGKTTAIIDVVPLFINANPQNKVLIVTPSIKKSTKGEFIADAINRVAGKEIAIGIDSHNIKNMKVLSQQYPVVVISSNRYRVFSKNLNQLKVLGEGRLHIIDENVNHVEPVSFTIQSLNELELIIPKPVDSDFRRITGPIRDILLQNVGELTLIDLVYPEDFDITLNRIIKVIKSSYSKEYLKALNVIEAVKLSKSDLIEKVEQIREFYNKRVFTNRDFSTGLQKLFTFDSTVIPIVSDHNLMINASASISKQYESDIFNVIDTPKVRDYSQFTLHIGQRSSSKQSLRSIKNFEETAMKYVEDTVFPNDDVLVLSYKDQLDRLKAVTNSNASYKVRHDMVHNLVGTNVYDNCNRMFIFGTPSVNGDITVLNYQYYINCDMKVKIDIDVTRFRSSQLSEDQLEQFSEEFADMYLNSHPNESLHPYDKELGLSNTIFPSSVQSADAYMESFEGALMEMYSKPTGIDIREDVNLKMTRKDRKMSYVFTELDDYHVSQIAEKLVQAILRMNRDGMHKADVYLMNSNDTVINKVIKSLPGINVAYDFDIDFNQQRQVYDNTRRQADSAAAKFLQLIQELDPGEYRKADIRNNLGMVRSSDLTRVLSNAEVVDYMERNGVTAKGQKIIKP